MREMAGSTTTAQLDGVDDLAASIMEAEGLERMVQWLEQHPQETEAQRRLVLTAFLQRYAKPEEVEETVNLPGWDEDLMAGLSHRYDADIDVIARIPGVNLLTP